MSPLERFGVDVILAAAVAVWFLVSGVLKLLPGPSAGRRAVNPAPAWLRVARRVRGVLEILGGLAVAGGAAITLLGVRVPFPGLAVGLVLGALAAWTVVDAVRPPFRGGRLVLALVGFALAVFYAGFRD